MKIMEYIYNCSRFYLMPDYNYVYSYDEDSDESNFEAFDDECPLLTNSNENMGASPGNAQSFNLKTSELNDFDNRRFFR